MSYGVGHRRGWDPMLLCLWHRPAATAPVRPLAWEPPYATRMVLKGQKTKKKKKRKKKRKKNHYCQNDYTSQGNLQIQWNHYKITNGIFHGTRTKKNLNVYGNTKDSE